MFDPLDIEAPPGEAMPPIRGALQQAPPPSPYRGLPVQSIVPESPLDLFTRKPFTAPPVSESERRAPPPIEHAPFSLLKVDSGAAQAEPDLTKLAEAFGKSKTPSAEEVLNRVKIAAAQTTTPTSKGKSSPSSPMPEVSSDRTDYYQSTGGFESGNNDNAVNPFYSPDKAAAGRFQFMPTTVASMRLQNPDLAKKIDANWRTDKGQQLLLMNAYTDISDTLIRQITGSDPSNHQRYLMHLFGHGMGAKILKDPALNIETFYPSKAAFAEAARVNPGVIVPGMTGEDFLKWAAPIFARKRDK